MNRPQAMAPLGQGITPATAAYGTNRAAAEQGIYSQ